jgi:hypothetical protein
MTATAPTTKPQANEVRLIAHLLTALVGLMLIAGGIAATFSEAPRVLPVALLAFGIAGVALPHYAWRGSRPAWAFAVALDGVLMPCLLFGSPKIARLFDINLAIAGLPVIISTAAFAMMINLASDYER